LKPGRSKKTISKNIEELIAAYKAKGMIGNTKPKDLEKARSIAAAIAYKKAGRRK